MWIIDKISSLFRLSYRIFAHLIITINRWVAFSMHLTMMFFVWNSLLIVIGIVRTTQMTIGLGYDVSNLTKPDKVSLEQEQEKEEKEEKEEKPQTYWQQRRKVYQEMIDNLYIKYMERLVEIQQDQVKYWQLDQNNYIFPQPRYDSYYDNLYYEEVEGQEIVEDNGETSSDASGDNGDNNNLFIPPGIKITEDTSMD